ncbi:MAG: glycine cleavage system protein GcvH [Candidatus Bipolaricaulota bacterium]|nr:glycine cleavage system protein GcvH [Candidatus Bipolaricaulota bacterium]
MAYPTQYRYTKEHEWINLEGARAKIGITEHAQSELGDVVFVELPTVGTQIKKGDNLGTVESVKAVSDIYAPLSGKVIEVNTELESAPETINQDPHGKGWLVVLEVADSSEADHLLDAAAYENEIA